MVDSVVEVVSTNDVVEVLDDDVVVLLEVVVVLLDVVVVGATGHARRKTVLQLRL